MMLYGYTVSKILQPFLSVAFTQLHLLPSNPSFVQYAPGTAPLTLPASGVHIGSSALSSAGL